MRIATFNANSIRSRLDVIRGWLEAHRPDVLCVQETKVQDPEFPLEALTGAGYRAVFRGQKSYNGVAILSRAAPAGVRAGFADGGPADAERLLEAVVNGVSLLNTYVPQGREVGHPMYAYKCEWFRRLRAHIEARFDRGDPLVWLGDMNVAHEPIDVHNPAQRTDHVCYHVDARAAFARCRDWGFVDVFRQHHPEPGHYTFFDYRTANAVGEGKGWRIDYILATPALAARCTDSFIDLAPRLGPKPSDHTFLVADFDWPATPPA